MATSIMAEDSFDMRAPASPTPSAASSSASALSSGELEAAEIMSLSLGKFLPETQEEADIVDEILAKELNEMSLVEQDRALFDVHGLPQVGDDDPEHLDPFFDELERELAKILVKPAFEEAKYVNPTYVNSKKFRIMFLRCERFDAKLAAEKLVKHFKVKKDIFGGGEILGRDVKLSDMSEEDMTWLKAASVQIFRSRDAAGRLVLLVFPVFHPISWESRLKEMWYMFTVAGMDEESQKKGIVVVVCAFGPLQPECHREMQRFHAAREGVPNRISSCHLCYDDETTRPYLSGKAFYYMTKAQRARSRQHLVDKIDDVVFELQTFGIPITGDIVKAGSSSFEWHHEWLRSREAIEKESANGGDESDVIVVPRRFDVLFGRGKNTREHTGNLRCSHLVEMSRPKYENANKYQKTEIAERIVSIIHESYGRFLKWNAKVRTAEYSNQYIPSET